MLSILRAIRVIGVILLLIGSSLGIVGISLQIMDTCESGSGITIHRLNANETPDASFDQVTYENLSTAEQRVFTEILTAETTPIYQNESAVYGLSQKVVTYRGEQYETSVPFIADCFNSGMGFMFLGSIIAILGGVIVVTPKVVRRLR